VVTVSYIAYTVQVGTFRLYTYMSLNVAVAVVQCVGFLVFSREFLYPADIGGFLYGSYSLGVGETGIGALGYLLPYRFSGLSREPGFFSSLLIASFLLLLNDRSVKRRNVILAVHAIGIVLGFSKISIAFFSVFLLVFLFRNLVNRVPKPVAIGVAVALLMVGTSYLYRTMGVDYLDPSLSHRTIGYAILGELSAPDLLFGVGFRNIASRMGEIPLIAHSIWYENAPGAILAGSGLSSVIIDHGLLYFLMLMFLLHVLRVNTYEMLLFLLLTVNENPLTSSSFVLIGIYYMLSSRPDAPPPGWSRPSPPRSPAGSSAPEPA